MRIAVVGSGGVGGYFGGRLAASGADVHFLARGAHLDALRTRGLRIESPNGDVQLPPVKASSEIHDIGVVDVVLFTVKMYDVDAAAALLQPVLGPDTVVITFQNGVEAVDMVSRHVPRQQVAGGVAYVAAVISEPGVIRHTAFDTLCFGELNNQASPRLTRLAEACRLAGFKAGLTTNIHSDLWSKFARLSVFSGITSVTRSPIGVLRDDPDLIALTTAACQESTDVARARGVDVPGDVIGDMLKMAEKVPHGKSSMLEDLERGKRLELPWLSGAVVRLGREAGVPTPVHHFVTTVLRPFENGRLAGR